PRADRVRAPDFTQRPLHGPVQAGGLPEVVLDQVGEDLGVGLGAEDVALGQQPLLQREIVLQDPVVDDDERARAVGVGVGVFLGGAAVGGPAGVPDADGAADW